MINYYILYDYLSFISKIEGGTILFLFVYKEYSALVTTTALDFKITEWPYAKWKVPQIISNYCKIK